jgi:hypothetical protein
MLFAAVHESAFGTKLTTPAGLAMWSMVKTTRLTQGLLPQPVEKLVPRRDRRP